MKPRHRVKIMVAEDQLSLAIGKRGQNARLTSKLTGWQIDIEPETVVTVGFEEKVAQAVQRSGRHSGLDAGSGQRVGACGIFDVGSFVSGGVADLEQIEQIKGQAPAIMAAIKAEAARRNGGEAAAKPESA